MRDGETPVAPAQDALAAAQTDRERQCWDPAHDERCDCGAEPDLEYERAVERRAER